MEVGYFHSVLFRKEDLITVIFQMNYNVQNHLSFDWRRIASKKIVEIPKLTGITD